MNKDKFTLIHIGKCGGSTLEKHFQTNKITFDNVHIRKPIYNTRAKYIILIRNPIQRFISAFNWRYKLVVEDETQKNRFRGERQVLTYYKTANNLAENIGSFNIDETYIHHIKENIHYYLGDILKNCKKENIACVLTTENLDKDMKQHFGFENTIHEKNNPMDKQISESAYTNLKQYLHKDYECIDALYKLGCLTEEQYTILSE